MIAAWGIQPLYPRVRPLLSIRDNCRDQSALLTPAPDIVESAHGNTMED